MFEERFTRSFIIDFVFEVTERAAFALRDRELYSDVQRAVDCRNQSGTPTAYARWSTGGMSHPPLAKVLPQTSSCLPTITTTATIRSQHRIKHCGVRGDTIPCSIV